MAGGFCFRSWHCDFVRGIWHFDFVRGILIWEPFWLSRGYTMQELEFQLGVALFVWWGWRWRSVFAVGLLLLYVAI